MDKEAFMTQRRYILWTLLLVGLAVIVPLTNALAQNDEAYIENRQKVMQAQGANMGAISGIVKNKLPFQHHIATHAREIQWSSTLIADAFRKQITEGKTDAKPEIWKEWDKFLAAAKELEQESDKLAEVAQGNDMEAIEAQVKKLGGACGNCHKPYRKPKEESYKNK
jgi:cytochrome c556